MIFRQVLCGLVVCLGVCVSAGEKLEPAGQVVTLPVETWSRSGGPVEKSAALMLPEKLDEQGTLTLIMQSSASTSLFAIDIADAPDALRFLFGDSRKIFVYTTSNDAWMSGDSTIVSSIPYDKTASPLRTRSLKILNAAAQPLKRFDLKIGLRRQFGSGPVISLPIGHDGTVVLPVVIDPFPRFTYPNMQPPTAYDIRLTDKATNQSFTVQLKQQGVTSQTVLLVPSYTGSLPPGLVRGEGQIVGPDGAPKSGVAVSLSQNYNFRTQSDIMCRDDPTTMIVTRSTSLSDGTFTFALSPEFGATGDSGSISAFVNEPNGLFTGKSIGLAPGQTTTIKLPKRLDLTAKLLEANGDEKNLESRMAGGSWTGILIKRVNSDGSIGDTDSIGINRGETTGSLFLLKGLAVPGRFMIEADRSLFGPVDVGETSPTEIIAFNAARQDGRLCGVVRDENGDPLPGALVVLSSSDEEYEKYDEPGDLITKLKASDKDGGLALLNELTSGAVDYAITTGTGEFSFPRKIGSESGNILRIIAAAPGRFVAHLFATTSASEVPLTNDVLISDVRLPAKTPARGIVSAPAMVPDEDHRGRLKPIPPGRNTYDVNHWSTMSWFPPRPEGSSFWQYDSPTRSFEFGKPFEYPVPVGTSFTLAAMPSDLPLSLELWKHGPVKIGQDVEFSSATLRALQPFNLKLVYANGDPASGLHISSIYGTRNRVENGKVIQAITDEKGMWSMYGDEGLSPDMAIMEYGPRGRRERFRIKHLDMSTSVPTLTLQLDPKIWGINGGGVQ